MWNPEALESGILFKESEILITIGIQNPSSTYKGGNPKSASVVPYHMFP